MKSSIILLVLFYCNLALAAISGNSEWNFDADTGSSVAGGCFDATIVNAGTDLSLDALTAGNTLTNAACAGAGNVFTHASASSTWIGNCVNAVSGTNITSTAGSSRFQVTAVAGTSVTVTTNKAGTSLCTGVSSDASINVGGSLIPYNSASDVSLIAQTVVGNIWYFKYGNYSMGSLTSTVGGTSTAPVKFIGYNTTQGDNTPTSFVLPKITVAGTWTAATIQQYQYLWFTGSSSPNFTGAINDLVIEYSKFTSTSTTSTDAAISLNSTGYFRYNEVSNPRGIGLSVVFRIPIYFNYFHDSDKGINTAAEIDNIEENIFSGFSTAAIVNTGATRLHAVKNNVFYGYASGTPKGIGISMTGGALMTYIHNNIFYGFVTAMSHNTASQKIVTEDFNTFYANTTDRTNIATGSNSIAVNPNFGNVVQRSASNCTTTAGNHLVCSGATFQTWGITAGTHHFYLASGTGTTNSVIYSIASVDSETQITTNETLTANATADKTFYMTTGFNWAASYNMVNRGAPRIIPATNTSVYGNIGLPRRPGLPRGR